MDSESTALRSPLSHPRIEGIWIASAAEVGLKVERVRSAYASTDGHGRIEIGVDEILDSADAIAQLIFHELCHGLVEGPERWSAPDWGLSNADARDIEREHACLRVQVHLAERYGLRELMAPTTEYRGYHDEISGDPLVHESDGAAAVAREAIDRASSRRWIDVLDRALAETRERLDACACGEVSPDIAAALHPVGFAFADNHETCGTCAWLYRGGRGRPVERCRQSAHSDGNGRRTEARFRACVRWEPPVACQNCGACCREAYHSVTVSVRDPVVWKQAALVVRTGHRFEIRRAGERCAALEETRTGGPSGRDGSAALDQTFEATSTRSAGRTFSCAIYADRPRACRDFEAGGAHCLVARRRVGLSP